VGATAGNKTPSSNKQFIIHTQYQTHGDEKSLRTTLNITVKSKREERKSKTTVTSQIKKQDK